MDLTKMVVIDISDQFKPDPRWALCTPPPGHGDISDFERQVAAEIGVVGVDDDLGFRNLFYGSEQEAVKVAVAMMRKRPELQIWVRGPAGQTYAPLAHVAAQVNVRINESS